MSGKINDRIDIKRSYAEMKAVEGGDINICLSQVRTLDPKTQMQWVAASLQREVYKLRGEIMRRQEAEDSRLDAEAIEKARIEIVVQLRRTIYAGKSWFSLFWEWIKSIPIGRRHEYEPENFERDEETETRTEIFVKALGNEVPTPPDSENSQDARIDEIEHISSD